jgi:hypothetical protein
MTSRSPFTRGCDAAASLTGRSLASAVAASSTMEAFEKLFASVQDPQTQDNHARHLALAKNVLYQNELGYFMMLFIDDANLPSRC